MDPGRCSLHEDGAVRALNPENNGNVLLLCGTGQTEKNLAYWGCSGRQLDVTGNGLTMAYPDRIVRDPGICAGQPVVRGTRVLVRTILGYLAHGDTVATILAEFPSLSDEDVRAVIAFAAASASEDLPAPAPIPPEIKCAAVRQCSVAHR